MYYPGAGYDTQHPANSKIIGTFVVILAEGVKWHMHHKLTNGIV